MKSKLALLVVLLGVVAFAGAGLGADAPPPTQCAPAAKYPAATTPVAFWSTEARCAIVPAGPGGSFGSENFGNKFPGEAAVYMGIVHVAMYDAAVALDGGYRPYVPTPAAPPDTSPEAAIAAAAYDTLTGLQPQLGADQTILDGDYSAYLAAIPDGTAVEKRAKRHGITVGGQVARAILALRANDGRELNPTLADLDPPAPGPGVWQPAPGVVLGLRLPGIKPLALTSASQLRLESPYPLTSRKYAEDLDQVKELGRLDSTVRTPEQTSQAQFWTDHDLRQWNDGMLRLAAAHRLDLVRTARMLAMAHVAGGDGMIACFDSKYHYWFWRPYQAIPLAGTDGNPTTVADPSWTPLATTPNFPEYPSAHACHSTAVVTALDAFFGTDKVPFTLDSRATHTTREYKRLHDIVNDVDQARVLVGFHFLSSDLRGSRLGSKVGRYVTNHYFRRSGSAVQSSTAASSSASSGAPRPS
ncbi:MAG TPA: vanadium-dependent haloperoxidase [Thermoleophilaceae bacterium]